MQVKLNAVQLEVRSRGGMAGPDTPSGSAAPSANGPLPSNSRRKVALGCALGLMLVCLAIVAVVLWLRYEFRKGHLELEELYAKLCERSYQEVKSGDSRVVINDPRLLWMLADDPECVANLTNVTFFTPVVITPADATQVAQLTNVRAMGFYCVGGADDVLKNAQSLPIELLHFEGTAVSPQSLRDLAKFPALKRVCFVNRPSAEQLAILGNLPPTITVETPGND